METNVFLITLLYEIMLMDIIKKNELFKEWNTIKKINYRMFLYFWCLKFVLMYCEENFN